MRELIRRFGVPICVVALIGAAVVYYLYGRATPAGDGAQVKAFYIDEETGEESVRRATDVPPMVGRNGKPSIVVAMKYSCDGGKTSKVGYLMKYTPEGKAAMDQMYASKKNEQPNINIMENILVRLPEAGNAWYRRQSEAGQRVVDAAACPGGQTMGIVPH